LKVAGLVCKAQRGFAQRSGASSSPPVLFLSIKNFAGNSVSIFSSLTNSIAPLIRDLEELKVEMLRAFNGF
jgi:hypothetical protein